MRLLRTSSSLRLFICLVTVLLITLFVDFRSPPQTIEVTRQIPVTQLVEAIRIVEVTRPVTVEVTRGAEIQIVEVTRVTIRVVTVEVTRVVTETVIVEKFVDYLDTTPTQISTEPAIEWVNQDILVWYDFEGDFTDSGIVPDRSGNGFDAQVNGTVGATNGISNGQAGFFDGGGYIQAGHNPAAGRTNVSFSFWFKTEYPSYNFKFASAAWWQGGPGSGWIMATHIPEFWSDDTNSLYLSGQTNTENNFPANEWVYEVVTYDGTFIKEYTNGQLINDWPTTGAEIGEGQDMAVGSWASYGFNFLGSIDEFKIYGRALTPEEIQEQYDQNKGE